MPAVGVGNAPEAATIKLRDLSYLIVSHQDIIELCSSQRIKQHCHNGMLNMRNKY